MSKDFKIRDCIVHFAYLCMMYAFIIATVIQFKPFHKLEFVNDKTILRIQNVK